MKRPIPTGYIKSEQNGIALSFFRADAYHYSESLRFFAKIWLADMLGFQQRWLNNLGHSLVHIVVMEKERISVDDVCTIFNAVMNTASEKIINAMMSEDEKLTREYIEILQRAGY